MRDQTYNILRSKIYFKFIKTKKKKICVFIILKLFQTIVVNGPNKI